MKQHVRNQHYVPKCLLKHFHSDDDPSHIWVYDMQNAIVSKRSLKSVPTEEYFYDKTLGHYTNSLEYPLGEIESDSAPIIKKIINQRSLESLTINEKTIIAEFVALLMLRTKMGFNEVDSFLIELMGPIKTLADYHNLEISEEPKPRELWLSILSAASDFKEILTSKLWFLLESNRGFFISDNPVVRNNGHNKMLDRGTLGLNSDGIEVYLPLSDSLLLCLLCERVYTKVKEITLAERDIAIINEMQVTNTKRFVFSSQNNFETMKFSMF